VVQPDEHRLRLERVHAQLLGLEPAADGVHVLRAQSPLEEDRARLAEARARPVEGARVLPAARARQPADDLAAHEAVADADDDQPAPGEAARERVDALARRPRGEVLVERARRAVAPGPRLGGGRAEVARREAEPDLRRRRERLALRAAHARVAPHGSEVARLERDDAREALRRQRQERRRRGAVVAGRRVVLRCGVVVAALAVAVVEGEREGVAGLAPRRVRAAREALDGLGHGSRCDCEPAFRRCRVARWLPCKCLWQSASC